METERHSNATGETGGRPTPAYDASRRTPRKHKRVVFHGTEKFDADGVKLEPGDMVTERQREADDDKRILGELPPHWAVFNERQ
ncbi:hypothetical protein [Bifidobacterium biavatii]|uniref:hypothetical protein n=1 Tax=Bifidobacterium biavatii TaxID=762212 RepID=UPI00068D92E7